MENTGDTMEKTETSKEAPKSPLVNKTIKVYPIKKARGLVDDPEHEAAFLIGNSTIEYVVPRRPDGKFKDPLTKEERRYLEEIDTSLDVGPGDLAMPTKATLDKGEYNFWTEYKVTLGQQGDTLDLNDPQDFIKYKVLLANSEAIATSWSERYDKRTYRYALVEEGEEAKEKTTRADKLAKAYEYFGNLNSDKDEMIKFLRIYGKRPSSNSDENFLKAQLSSIIDEDLDGFLRILDDPNYEMKDFINRALSIGALTKEKNQYKLPGGDIIGRSIEETIEWLSDPANNDVYTHIQDKLEMNDS